MILQYQTNYSAQQLLKYIENFPNMEIYLWWMKVENILEVDGKDGSDAKYNAIASALAHPLEPLEYIVIRWSKSGSPIDEVAKGSRADLVEFLDLMREKVGFSLLCEKLGKETERERERVGLLKEALVFSREPRVLGCRR